MPFDLPTFTLIHVVLSLVGIFAGLVVVGGLMAGAHFARWAGLFLAATALTNVTGFGFRSQRFCRRTSWARAEPEGAGVGVLVLGRQVGWCGLPRLPRHSHAAILRHACSA